MFCKTCVTAVCLAAVAAVTIAAAQPGNDHKHPTPSAPAAGQPEMKLPPGMTPADMQACMEAGTPGKNHEWLTKSVGTWQGKEQMWMTPGAEVVNTQCTQTTTSLMDGRFIKCDITGDMPGMPGPFVGMGITGYDNVSQKFVSTWIDNCGTGIMNGTGDLSSDGKVLTITYTANCPITKKPTTMREVLTMTGPDTHTMDMFGIDPKSGKEFKMLHIDFKKK